MKRQSTSPAQLGFDKLLAETDRVNERAAFDKQYGHLPGTMEEALPFYRDLNRQHHAAMLAAESAEIFRLRGVAESLALRLNDGDPGILAGPDAPGCLLARLTLADEGAVPLWGQGGSFVIEVLGMRVRIDMDGLYGIGANYCPWMNFSASAVDRDKPFLSETGYRSFLGIHADLVPGLTPDTFAASVIGEYVRRHLKGRLVAIGEPKPRRARKRTAA